MEKKQEHELFLNGITIWEQVVNGDTFEEYKNYAIVLMQSKDMYLFEDEVLKNHKATINTIEQVLKEFPHIVSTGAHRKNKNGSFSKKYLHIAAQYFVLPDDILYDVFFAYKLRQVDLLEMDAFLDYQLSNYYETNVQQFSRFLRLCIRKHEVKLLKSETIQTVNEWLTDKEKQQQGLQGTLENKSKTKRKPKDDKTSLSEEQTVLLMYYLQREKVILKDLEDSYMGQAFEILTGYSQHSLRQDLSKYNTCQTKINLKALNSLLAKLKTAIDETLATK